MSVVGGFVVAIGIGFVAILSTLMTWPWAAMRFVQDFLPPMLLLGGLGFWKLYPRSGAPWRRHLAYAALAMTVGVPTLVVGLALGFNQLAFGQVQAYVRLAYRLDTVTAGVLRLVAPSTWPSSYYSAGVKQRPWGVFYPERHQLTLSAPPDGWIRSVELDSLFQDRTRVQVEINGNIVASERLMPSLGAVNLDQPIQVSPHAPVAVRLRFPSQPARPEGDLWPIRVRGLSNKVDARQTR